MKRKWLWVGSTLVLAAVVLVGLSLRQPRSEVSRSLHFLDDYAPVKSAYEDQNYSVSYAPGEMRKVIALVEEFELPKSFREVCDMARPEMKPRAYHTNFHPPTMLYSLMEPQHRWSTVVTITDRGPTKTTIRFVTTSQPGPMDRFFWWVRRLIGR